jgi:hypothetical protein
MSDQARRVRKRPGPGPGRSRWILASAALGLLLLAGWGIGCTVGDRPELSFEAAPHPLTPDASRDPQLIVRASGAIAALAVQPGAEGGEDLRLFMSRSRGDVFEAGARVNSQTGGVLSPGEGTPLFLQAPRGKFYAVWLGHRSESDRLATLWVARSDDFLRSFSEPVAVDPDSDAGPSFFDATVAPDGTLIVSWLGRGSGETLPGSSQVLISSSRDGGRSFSPATTAAADICPCCRPAVAADDRGHWFLAWRKMDEENVRDLVVATSKDRGASWSLGQTVPGPSWQIDGCPHSGPSLRVLDDDLYLAWYTEATGQSRLFWSKSADAGRTFSAAADIAGEILDPNHPRLGEADGRLFVAFQGRDPVEASSWGPATIFVREIGSGGGSAPVALPRGQGSASYPVLSGLGAGRLVVAWTDSTEAGPVVLTARGRLAGH